MRNWKVLSISLLSPRMLYFRENVGLNNSCISLLLVKLQPELEVVKSHSSN